MIIERWKKQDEWYWEGNLQTRVVSLLRKRGYQTYASDTLSKERGPDILAVKGDEKVLFEVKGWPGDKFADGIRAGEKKKANPNAQAGTWFSEAMLTLMKAKTNYPDHALILVVPDFPRYRRLAEATKTAVDLLGFKIWYVNVNGEVIEDGREEGNQKKPIQQDRSISSKSEGCELFYSSSGNGTLLLTFWLDDGSVFFKDRSQAGEMKAIWQEWAFQKESPHVLQKVENPSPAGDAAREKFYRALEPTNYQTGFVKKINQERPIGLPDLLFATLSQLRQDGWRLIMKNVVPTPREKLSSGHWNGEEWDDYLTRFPADSDMRPGWHLFEREIPLRSLEE